MRLLDKPKAMFFDIDNTLLDRIETLKRFIPEMISRYMPHVKEQNQIDWMVEEAIRLDHYGYRNKKLVLSDIVSCWRWPNPPSVDELETFWEDNFPRLSCPVEGMYDTFLKIIRRGVPIGIISNDRSYIAKRKLAAMEIADFLSVTLCSDEAGWEKPDSRIFIMAAEQMGVSPAQCIFTGDSIRTDIEGALQAGMQAVWYEGAFPEILTDVKIPEIHVIQKLPEIINIIDF